MIKVQQHISFHLDISLVDITKFCLLCFFFLNSNLFAQSVEEQTIITFQDSISVENNHFTTHITVQGGASLWIDGKKINSRVQTQTNSPTKKNSVIRKQIAALKTISPERQHSTVAKHNSKILAPSNSSGVLFSGTHEKDKFIAQEGFSKNIHKSTCIDSKNLSLTRLRSNTYNLFLSSLKLNSFTSVFQVRPPPTFS